MFPLQKKKEMQQSKKHALNTKTNTNTETDHNKVAKQLGNYV